MNLSRNQTLLTLLLYVRQTWMTQLILAISLSEESMYLPLIQNDSTTPMYSRAVSLKEELLFAWDLSIENCVNPYLYF